MQRGRPGKRKSHLTNFQSTSSPSTQEMSFGTRFSGQNSALLTAVTTEVCTPVKLFEYLRARAILRDISLQFSPEKYAVIKFYPRYRGEKRSFKVNNNLAHITVVHGVTLENSFRKESFIRRYQRIDFHFRGIKSGFARTSINPLTNERSNYPHIHGNK